MNRLIKIFLLSFVFIYFNQIVNGQFTVFQTSTLADTYNYSNCGIGTLNSGGYPSQNNYDPCDQILSYISLQNFTTQLSFRYLTKVYKNGIFQYDLEWPYVGHPTWPDGWVNQNIGSSAWHCNEPPTSEGDYHLDFYIKLQSGSPDIYCGMWDYSVAEHPDYAPLMALYNSTNGPGWTNKTGWVDGAAGTNCDPCNGWYGVTCTNGRVSGLNLGGNQLSGPIPSSIGNLSNLQQLILPTNQLSGTIPSSLSNLSNLQLLNFSTNQLSGTIPSSLGNLSNLQLLYLDSNQLSGPIPSSLGNISNLQTLFLLSNQLSGSIPSSLGNLSNLQVLYLHFNQLSGPIPSPLGNLTNLQALLLNSNQLEGCIPEELQNICSANGDISNNPLLATQSWTNFCNNQEGMCQACGTHPDYAPLMALYNSTNGPGWTNNTGWVDGAAMTNCDPCNGWYGVTCTNGRVTCIDLDGSLNCFATTGLGGNNLNGPLVAEIGDLTFLEGLFLGDNLLSGALPTELGDLANLQDLALDYNQFSGNIPIEIGQLTNLKTLGLYSNNLVGNIPPEIGDLTNLGALRLNGNSFSGNIPPEIGQLSSLYFLGLAYNNLSGNIPYELGNLSSLNLLKLQFNNLSGCIPEELQALCPNVTGNDGDISDNPLLATQSWTDFCQQNAGRQPIANAGPDKVLPCGGTIMLDGSGSSLWPSVSYVWTGPLGAIFTPDNMDQNPSVNLPGEYTITVSNGNNCSATDQVVVSGSPPPTAPSIQSSGTLSFCVGGSVTLTAIPQNWSSYNWFKNGSIINGQNGASLNVNETGDYSVRAVDFAGCESVESMPITVTVHPIPMSPSIGLVTQPRCDDPTGTVQLNGLPSENYIILAEPGGLTLNGSSPSITFLNLNPNTDYSFTVEIVSTGCISPSSADVQINGIPSSPDISINVVGDNPICK